MAQGLTIEEIININTTIQDGGTVRTEFGTGLLLTTSNRLAGSGANKCLRFGNQNEVVAYFGSSDTIADDAAAWFGADPAPKSLYIGRWVAEGTSNTIISSPALAGAQAVDIASLEAIQNGSFTINGASVGTINFDGITSLTDAATKMQAAIRTVTGFTTATVTFDGTTSKMTINFGTSTPVTLGRTVTSGTVDFLDILHLTSDAEVMQGSAIETVAEAFTRCIALATAGAPAALMLASDTPETYRTPAQDARKEARDFAQSGDYMYAMLDTSDAALVNNDNTSALASAFSAGQSNVIPVYSRPAQGFETSGPRPDIAIMAKLSSQNFNLPQSIITLQAKTLPSVPTTIVTNTQFQELQRKRVNLYTDVGGVPTLLGGYSAANGVWADAQWWLLWLKNEMEVSIFQAMRSSNRLENAVLTDTINDVMAKAITSGGAQPGGRVNNSIKHDIQRATGNAEFDGILSTGYILWIQPPQQLTDTDRSNRVSRFTVWVAPSEAIHTVSSAIILSG